MAATLDDCDAAWRLIRERPAATTPEARLDHVDKVIEILGQHHDLLEASQVLAAILHDSVESGQTTLDEIAQLFGLQAAEAVEHLTEERPRCRRDFMTNAGWLRLHPEILEVRLAARLESWQRVLRYPDPRDPALAFYRGEYLFFRAGLQTRSKKFDHSDYWLRLDALFDNLPSVTWRDPDTLRQHWGVGGYPFDTGLPRG